MKKILLFASIVALLASCSPKPKYELEVNIHNDDSLINKQLIVAQRVEGKTVYTDTTKIKKNNFLLKIPYEGPALLTVSIPQTNIYNVLIAAEEGKIQLDIEDGKARIGGTPINDRLQVFIHGNDSVSLLFNEFDKEYALARDSEAFTPQIRDEFRQRRTQLLIENTDRLVAFIRENVDNPIGEYYFMTNYITLIPERQLELRGFATERLKKEFGFE